MSTEAAGLAVKWGYKNVRVMVKGMPGWKKAGNLAVASNDFVKKGNAVIVDLRSAEAAGKGFIPRAVNLPFAKFEDVEDSLPKAKSAPFVLYGNGDEPKKAIKQLAEWGYKNTAVVNGGLDGWAKAGGELATGAPAKEITYKRELEKGEVGAEEFRKAVSGETGGMAILDVRTKDEVAEGAFPKAITIPLDELEKRMAELPKDKELLVHCTTGDRASMAADQLRKAGFKVRHLVAAVECPDGKCVVSE